MYAIPMSKKRINTIDKKIEHIKAELALIGEMRPGSLTKQFRDPENQMGAYYQISYTHEMKSRTEYIRKENVKEIRQQIQNYKRYKKLTTEWVALSIERSKLAMKLSRSESA